MTFNFAKSAATALKLITKFGASGTLVKRAAGSNDPATGSNTITETSYTVKAVLLNYRANETNTQGSLVQAKDRKVIMQATTVTPDVSDTFTFNSVTYRVVEVKTLNPAGTNVLHELRVSV
jgi:phospholipase/lecithinase/hemolysin